MRENVVELLLGGRALAERGDDAGAERAFARALQIEPLFAAAHRERAHVLVRRDDLSQALDELKASVKISASRVPATGSDPLRVVQLGSVHAGGHTNTDRVLSAAATETTTVLIEYWDPAWELPPHDLLFNAIADADVASTALDIAQYVAERSPAAIVNAPAAVRKTTRTENAIRLRGIAHLRVPAVERVSRERLRTLRDFPFLLRAPGYHNGTHVALVRNRAELEVAASALPGEQFLAIEYVDGLAADGKIRKYRAMIVGDELYPAHLAIGNAWNLHYFSASMGSSERAEEAAYLRDMDAALGRPACAALRAIGRELGLEYAGVDFGVDPDGHVVLYEANASMTLFLPDGPDEGYRRNAVLAIDQALSVLLRAKAASAHSSI
jgi:glutathione synthase/RimK-type ligase-like ATP-grasp enzyme